VTRPKSLNLLLWLVAIGFFMQTLDATIVNTALPAMASSLGESPLRMQSVVVGYTLTMALLIPASGWLADRFGTRRVFMSAIVLFVIGSALCASSRTLGQIVASRVLQGMGGAMLLPVGRLAVLRTFPREEFLRAMSFVTVPGLIGPLIGPLLGGWLAQTLSWHWIFLINIPVGVVGCIATYGFMPDSRDPAVGRFDFTGYLLLAFGMAAMSLSIDGLSELGLRHATVLVLLVFGLSAVTAYWLRSVNQSQPLFPLQLFKVPTFSVGLLGNLFARIGSGAMPFLIPLLLQLTMGYTPVQAGMTMVPVAAAGMFAKQIGTAIIKRAGYRQVLISNTLLLGVIMASFAAITPREPLWLLVVQLALFGAVNSLQFTAMNTVTLKDLDRGLASSGNSLLSMTMMLSMSFGVAAAGGLLGAFVEVFSSSAVSQSLSAFHATFACVGVLTCASAWIFWQLAPDSNGGPGKAEAG
jgi:EmrB/QacA subfamily drug resistance transporter